MNKNIGKSNNESKTITFSALSILGFAYITKKFKALHKKQELKRKMDIEEEVDFNNIIDSAFMSEKLFDTLKVKCHPDRFTNEEKNKLAIELFQEINKNRYNLNELEKLKHRAIDELEIII